VDYIQAAHSQCLRKELKNANIDTTAFSTPCIEEFANYIVRRIEFDKDVGLIKGPLNSFLEERARVIAGWIEGIVTGDDDYTAEKIKAGVANGTPDLVWSILAKHHPELFSLQHLEKMQLANELLRRHHEELAKQRPGSRG
jgi:hypothetical protein